MFLSCSNPKHLRQERVKDTEKKVKSINGKIFNLEILVELNHSEQQVATETMEKPFNDTIDLEKTCGNFPDAHLLQVNLLPLVFFPI